MGEGSAADVLQIRERSGDGQTRWQRCWVHKTANVLDKLPRALQPQAKQRLQATWMAPGRQRAAMAFDLFVTIYEAKSPKAAECLAQDREVLWAFDDFPAGHWGHLAPCCPAMLHKATRRDGWHELYGRLR